MTDPVKLLYGGRTALHREVLLDAAESTWRVEIDRSDLGWIEQRDDLAFIERLLDRHGLARAEIAARRADWERLAGDLYHSRCWQEQESRWHGFAAALAALPHFRFTALSFAIEPIVWAKVARSPLRSAFHERIGAFPCDANRLQLCPVVRRRAGRVEANRCVGLIFDLGDVGAYNSDLIPPVAYLPEGCSRERLPMLASIYESQESLLKDLHLWVGAYEYMWE